jgi:hypothetical protein
VVGEWGIKAGSTKESSTRIWSKPGTFDLLMMGFQKGIIKGFQKYNLEFKR